ncbi:MAG TPA: hypothetical protein VK971_01165 [Thiohalobacter sp.]|nr:hypothetical protein [Thiohalobacter sp.]
MHTTGPGEAAGHAGNDTHTPAREILRLRARLEAFMDFRGEIEPWLMEERDIAGREALDNVLLHQDAEIAEQQRRLETMTTSGQHSN